MQLLSQTFCAAGSATFLYALGMSIGGSQPSLNPQTSSSRALGSLQDQTQLILEIGRLISDFRLTSFRRAFIQKVPCLDVAVRLVKVLVSLLVEGHSNERHLGDSCRKEQTGRAEALHFH